MFGSCNDNRRKACKFRGDVFGLETALMTLAAAEMMIRPGPGRLTVCGSSGLVLPQTHSSEATLADNATPTKHQVQLDDTASSSDTALSMPLRQAALGGPLP